jgi:hypothetical protein
MAQLNTKIKLYAAANGVANIDFRTDVMLQDDRSWCLYQGMEFRYCRAY